MTKPLSDFYDLLIPELPGITTGMVDLHLVHTARAFCTTTSAWRTQWAQSSYADRARYDISAPEEKSEIVRVTRLAVAGILLWDDLWLPDAPGDVPKYGRNEPPFTVNDENTEVTLIDDETPDATTAGAMDFTAALKPAFNATRLPDMLHAQHQEAMRMGTLSRLMRMGGKPWTDRPLATDYQNEYMRLANKAASNAQQGNTNARLRVRKWG